MPKISTYLKHYIKYQLISFSERIRYKKKKNSNKINLFK